MYKNKPYVKEMDGDKCLNPITKENPYRTFLKQPKRKSVKNNKKGVRLLIMNVGRGVFAKYFIREQTVFDKKTGRNKVIQHYVEKKRKK